MYGQEYAYVPQHQNGNPLDLYMKLKDKQDQDQRYQQELQRQQRQYQDALMGQAMSQLDFKHIATGTVVDPVLYNSMGNYLKNISQKIVSNPDVSSASVYYDVAAAANDLAAYSSKVKNIRANAEAAAKEYAKDPFIDQNKLFSTILTTALTKYDPNTHTFKVKDPYEIDDTKDWVAETLQQHPNQVVKDGSLIAPLNTISQNYNKSPYKNLFKVKEGGISNDESYEGVTYPYNTIPKDKDGKPIYDPKLGKVNVGVRSDVVNGVPIATKDDLDYFTSTTGAKTFLNAQIKNLGIDPNSEEGDLYKRKYLYDYLTKNNLGKIDRTKLGSDDSQLQSQNFRRDMKAWSASLKNALSGSGQGGKDATINDVYQDIKETGGRMNSYGIPLNYLKPETQAVLMKHAQTMLGKNPDNSMPNVHQVWVRKNTDGSYSLMQAGKDDVMNYNDLQISPLDFKNVNDLAAHSAKERQAVSNSSNQTKTTTTTTHFIGLPKTGKF